MRVLDPDVLPTGVLVIGAGAAGLRVAIELAGSGIECLVVGKREHGDAHTRWAAGGINASLGSRDLDDRWQLHAADTLREGHFVCAPRAVELLAREAPQRVRELAEWGCPFARTEDGDLEQRYFGAQSFRRTCFVGDETGDAILQTLIKRSEALNVAWMERVFVTSLLKHEGRVVGAYALDLDEDRTLVLLAPVTVLAAGGYTSIFARGSSRGDENTGDAAWLALEAGAPLRDMEFVQFHPTGWVHPPHLRGQLVTEAVRGEGGRLRNVHGERFMERYSPEQMELDARDIVARAIYTEIQEGRGTARGGVLLDISHRDPEFIASRLPHLQEVAREHQVDLTREPLEVAPTAHYAMGGVEVSCDTGETGVSGLLAAGEASGGLHGANRLGGNSLAETVVFGQRVGAHIVTLGIPPVLRQLPSACWRDAADHVARVRNSTGQERAEALIEELKAAMWTYAGIVRTGDGLRRGLRQLRELARRSADGVAVRGGTRAELMAALDLRCMLVSAEAVVRCALLREESRGAHYRADHPAEREEWRRTVICRRGSNGELELGVRDIPRVSEEILAALDEERELHYHLLE